MRFIYFVFYSPMILFIIFILLVGGILTISPVRALKEIPDAFSMYVDFIKSLPSTREVYRRITNMAASTYEGIIERLDAVPVGLAAFIVLAISVIIGAVMLFFGIYII